jgi:hypothetical protein
VVLGAALFAPATASALDVPELPKLPQVQLPEPSISPPAVPVPAVPDLPSMPEVLPLPKLPAPVPTAVPIPRPAAPAPAEPAAAAPASAGPSAPAATPAAEAPSRRRSGDAASPSRGTTRRAPSRPRAARPAQVTRTVALRPAAVAKAEADPEPPGRVERLADEFVDIAKAVPAAILWALAILAALALWLAGSAYWQSRRRAALESQRATLLDDIGVLSSALLPPVPEGLDGLDVTAAYRPADGPGAGGDFYDVFALEDGRVGVLLGDVSGHGRASLRHAALARYTLRTLLSAGLPVGEALARADRLLVKDLRPHFVTVIAALYDLEGGRLTYAKAGHPPPIVLGAPHDPDGEVPAPPIGLGLGEVWPEYHVDLTDGTAVCLFTDGLEDAKVNGARLGRCEVERLLAAHDVPCAERLLAEVGAAADSVGDDTAAIVLRRSGG